MNRDISDEQLIRQYQRGNSAAFDELVIRYRGPLYNFICRIIGDKMYAEDLLQETFLRLYLNKNSYREIAKFSTWIYTIAGNLAKTELRRRRIRKLLPLGGNDDDRPLEIPDENADIHQDLERRIVQERIEEEIKRLPMVFREVVILRDMQELSYEEISNILKVPIGTVKSRVSRGRQRLQKRLGDLL